MHSFFKYCAVFILGAATLALAHNERVGHRHASTEATHPRRCISCENLIIQLADERRFKAVLQDAVQDLAHKVCICGGYSEEECDE